MDLKSLLRPEGDALKPVPYALAYSLVGASGPLVVALQYRDYFWAAGTVTYAIYSALFVLAAGHVVWLSFGNRMPTAVGLGLAVVAACLASQATGMQLQDPIREGHPRKSYAHRLQLARRPMLWWGPAAAAWDTLQRAAGPAARIP